MPKRQNETDGDDDTTKQKQKRDDDQTTGSTSKKARIIPGTNSTTEKPPASRGLKNTLHGNVFQLKLLMLFLLRGIGGGFQFRLGTEMPGMGGKFDDLIFKFKKSDQTSESYRFLQAKHKQDEKKKITAAHLLNDNDGDFSLPKYFRSYCRDIIKGTEEILPKNVQDCIICTNIGFDSEKKLKESGIELKPLVDRDNILSFDQTSDKKTPAHVKIPARYRLEKTEELRKIMTAGWSDVHLLAETLLDYVTKKKQLDQRSPIFKVYHVALVNREVINKKEGKLCTTFLEGDNSHLSHYGTTEFREILSEITFVLYWEKLSFKSEKKKTIRTDGTKKLTLFEGTSIEKHLPKYSTTMEFDFRVFEDYYKDLVAQKVIVPEWRAKANKKLFTNKFVRGINQTQAGLEFRGKLRSAVFIHYWKDLTIQLSKSFGINSKTDENKSLNDLVGDDKEIDDFLDKLVFAVHTPNEVKLGDILKNEVGKYYQLRDSDFQSVFILEKMLDWFKEKDSQFMASEDGIDVLKNGREKMESLRETSISIDYQKQLKEMLEFNDKAIEEMKEKLTQLLTSADNRIGRIATSLPKCTAVKVIASLEKLSEEKKKKKITHNTTTFVKYFQYKDSYLVTSLSRLQKDCSKFKKIFESEKSHNLLLVVCEDGISTENEDELYQNLVDNMQNKKIIIISQGGAEMEDKLNFGDLSEESKRALLEKQIDFQGTLQSVEDLIKRGNTTSDDLMHNRDIGKFIDFDSIEELIKTSTIEIPKCSSARFEPFLYIKRKMEHPWENSFYDEVAKKMKCTTDELQKECTVDSQGYIKWFIAEGSRKEKIWTQMKNIVERKGKLSNSDIAEEKLIDIKERRKGQVMIISGLAGTGKSTILSNYYEIIKRDNPDIWAIRIDLVDYSKELAEFNFSIVNESSAIAFFADIFAKKSPFARSLLTHRFRTGGRIVVMLDGYDEIGGKLHEQVFQLIKAVKLTKMDALYITTRSHLEETLQNQICQFSYNFQNFSQKDQIECLSKYWGSRPKMSQATDGLIQLFAESLVVCLTTTLNDRESDFIGIPLQCRMLAECFECQLQDTIQQELPIDSLIENISENGLDLASLYFLFMEKKLEIYRTEKLKVCSQAEWVIESTIKNLEKYLRKLAITTIVGHPNYVNILLGPSNPFQTNREIRQEEEDFTNGGVRIGFLDKTDKGEVKFVHRTYAEYLFAKYLSAGFLSEDNDDCNHLLTSEYVRKLIFKEILGYSNSYTGVRVFLNSMLIQEKERVQPREDIPFRIKNYYLVLNTAIEETNSNIFLFMCGCLGMKFSKEEIGKFIRKKFCDEEDTGTIFSDLYCNNIEVFKRFMSYYDNITDAGATSQILGELSYFLLELDSEENEKTLEFVGLVVDFLDQRQEAFLQISQRDFKNVCVILKFLFSNKYYDSLLKKYLKLLSLAFSNLKIQFEYCLVESLEIDCQCAEEYMQRCRDSCYYSLSQETIDYILENLRILEKESKEKDIPKVMSHHILRRNTKLFKSIYKLKETVESDSLPINIQSLLERDSRGMTRLHRAAFRDDEETEETVNQILKTVRISYLSNETECKNLGKEVLHNVTASEEKGVTPLYVAAACEHENLCQKMLIFLKEMLSEDELRKYLKDANGFLSNALWDAIKWKKVKMFRIVLKSVQKCLGQDYLIALMKDESKRSVNVFSACHDEIFLDIVVKVIVNGENGYKHLTDLLLQNWKSIKHLREINDETFQKILLLNGLDDFIKRIFDADAHKGMYFVVCHILDKFTTEQREQLLCSILITENSGTKSYFARCWLESYWPSSKEILECFFKYLGQSVVNELLVRNEYEIIKNVLGLCDRDSVYTIKNGVSSLVDFMFSLINKEEVIHHMTVIVLQLIEKITGTRNQEDKNDHNDATRKILKHVFQRVQYCVEVSDLSKLIDLISSRPLTKPKEIKIWINYLVEEFRHYHSAEKFLNCVLVELGPSAVEELARKEAITQVLTLKHETLSCDIIYKVNVLIYYLSEKKREEIKLEVMKNVPTTIKTLIDTEPEKVGHFWMNILRLEYVTKYADSVVLQQLIEIITQPYTLYPDNVRTTSVWSSYLDCEYDEHNDRFDLRKRFETVDKFLLCVSDKLGKNKVKELVLHSCYHYGACHSVISSAASYGEKDLVEAMLAHLTEADRQEIQRDHVDPAFEFDAETLKSNYSTDEEISSSSDSIDDNSDDNSDEAISNRK